MFKNLKKVLLITMAAAFGSGASYAEGMPQIYLTFSETLSPDMEDYIPGTMVLTDTDGTSWDIPNVMLKTRGATAKQFHLKPSLNIKLKDEKGEELDTDLLGLRKASSFILDAMAIDRINMRNRVAFDIWNSFSRLPYQTDFGSRNGTLGKFVEMYVNGKYSGIYCLSDKINRKLLDLKKPEIDDATGDVTIRGILYKNGTNDIKDQNTPGFFNDFLVYVAEWHDAWELHEPEDYACEEVWSPLADLYAISASGKPNYEVYTYVQDHFWMENLADLAVHTIALGIADNWGNKNKYFSIQNVTKSDERSLFVVTPWDLDTSLGGEWDGSKYDGDLKTDWTVSDAEHKLPVPLSGCFNEPEFRQLMKSRWLQGRTGAFAVDSVAQRLNDYAELFISSGAWQRTVDARNAHDLICTDLKTEIADIVEWYAGRFADMDAFLEVTEEDIRNAGVALPGIEDEADCVIYNLQGIRVTGTPYPGIYIKGGKKILVR